MSVTLTAMRYFVEVARGENFSAAAERLYTAQSNLSKTVSGLERTLGVEFFYRDGRYARLTEAGRYLYTEWSAALERIDVSIGQAKLMERGRTESVTVGMLEGLGITPRALEWFAELRRHDPGVEVRLEQGGISRLRREFDAGNIDLIVTSELRGMSGAALASAGRRVVDTCRGVVAVSKKSPLARQAEPSAAALREENFVALSREEMPEEYALFREICRRVGFEPRVTRQATSIETLLLYVEAGMGAAVLGANCRLASNPDVRLIPLEGIDLDTVIYWHPGSLHPAVRRIVENM